MIGEPQPSSSKVGINSEPSHLDSENQTKEIDLILVGNLFSDISEYNRRNSLKTIIQKATETSIETSYQSTPTEPISQIPKFLRRHPVETKELISSIVAEKIRFFEIYRTIPISNQTEMTNFNNSLNYQKQEQEGHLNDINNHYQILLQQLGLSIKTSHDVINIDFNNRLFNGSEEGKIYISIGNTDLTESQITYNISDQEKFLSFLKELNIKSLNGNLKKGLINLLDNLLYQPDKKYNFSRPNQTTIDQIISLREQLTPNLIVEEL